MDPGPSSPQRNVSQSHRSGIQTPQHRGGSESIGISGASNIYRTASAERSRRSRRGELFTPSTARKYVRQGQNVVEPLFDDEEMIFGTKIKTSDVRDRFRRFLDTFDPNGEFDEMGFSLSHYTQILKEIAMFGKIHFCVDLSHVYAFDKMLYFYIVSYPLHVIPLVDKQLISIAELELEVECTQPLEFRPFNMLDVKSIRELDPSDMYKMICVEGMVTRTSSVIPQIKLACFRCKTCKNMVEVTTDMNRVKEPTACERCNSKYSFEMKHTWSIFGSRQIVMMQESPNHIPEGETAHTIPINAHDAMVEKCRPGDKVRITGSIHFLRFERSIGHLGLYCSEMRRLNPIKRTVESVCKSYIDLLHVEVIDESKRKGETDPDKMKEEEAINIEYETELMKDLTLSNTIAKESEMTVRRLGRVFLIEIQMMGSDPNIYEKLVASLAPSVWEMEDVKKGLLCLLFGGTDLEAMGLGNGESHLRSDINILLVGDPGVSKSQLLLYVHKLSTRGLYASGKGSSAVGLTAFISKDLETKEIVLESGALVLSDRGICCIDEFDKMSQSARSTLHEVMEQQTCSIAKAGIVSTLNARVSILASANPVGSKYNPNLTIVENIQLPPSLISRFDMIFLILDIPNEQRDQRLAKHLIALTSDAETASQQIPYPRNKMREFIAYARETCHPKLTKESGSLCIQSYVDARQEGKECDTVTATTRQLESFIRISEALAKMELSETVEPKHVIEAVRLVKTALRTSFVDKSGRMDLDQLFSGISQQERILRKFLIEEGQKIIRSAGTISFMQLFARLSALRPNSFSQHFLREALESLEDEILFRPNDVISLRE